MLARIDICFSRPIDGFSRSFSAPLGRDWDICGRVLWKAPSTDRSLPEIDTWVDISIAVFIHLTLKHKEETKSTFPPHFLIPRSVRPRSSIDELQPPHDSTN